VIAKPSRRIVRLRFRFPPHRHFVLSFIFTGSVKVAGSIAGAEAITKMIVYYLHERAWSVIRWDQQGQTGGGSSSP
jgi:uncharacterized membrane protein